MSGMGDGLRNLGPRSRAWLGEVGIETGDDLRRVGSVGAYLRVREAGLSASLNLLYALEAALMDIDWRDLPADLKAELRESVGEVR